jgi:hypothetical protein
LPGADDLLENTFHPVGEAQGGSGAGISGWQWTFQVLEPEGSKVYCRMAVTGLPP